MAAEGPQDRNWRKPRFVLKTKGVITRALDEGVLFQDVRNYDALIEAFLPRMLTDDQIRDAPEGVYCWILRETEGERHVYAMKVISEQEIGSLHNFLFVLTSDRSVPLTFEEKFINAAEVIAAGELRIRNHNEEREILWNLQSGSFMEPIFGIKSLALIKPRTYKTAEQLAMEIADKLKRRDELVEIVSGYLPGHFAAVDLPPVMEPFRNTGVSTYVGAVSHALGGEPFLHGDPIITSANNMEMLRALLSSDTPKRKDHGGWRRSAAGRKSAIFFHPTPLSHRTHRARKTRLCRGKKNTCRAHRR
jgi:hypothetical protein